MAENEQYFYKGGPSQITNYKVFLFCAIFFAIALYAPSFWESSLVAKPGMLQHKDMYFLVSKILFFIPLLIAFSAWVKVRHHRYLISTERISEQEGVLSRSTNDLELYRVKDMTLDQPFFLRIFKCGNIVLETSDRTTPVVVLYAVKHPRALLDKIRQHVERMRTVKGVREID